MVERMKRTMYASARASLIISREKFADTSPLACIACTVEVDRLAVGCKVSRQDEGPAFLRSWPSLVAMADSGT